MTETREVKDFFELDFRRGVMRNKYDGARVFVIAAKAFRTIEEGLYRSFSTGAAVMLRQMGYSYGKALAGRQRSLESGSNIAIVADLQAVALAAGWGRVSLPGDPLSDNNLKIIVEDCVFCTHYRQDVGEPRCHFLVGLIQGVAEELFMNQFIASETRCVRIGGPFCEIELTRKTDSL